MEVKRKARDLRSAAGIILKTPQPAEKAKLTQQFVEKWNSGELSVVIPENSNDNINIQNIESCSIPERPHRDNSVDVVQPGQTPRRGIGTTERKLALLHSLCHIESWAIDLSWDIIGRFINPENATPKMPREFYDDWVRVASEEAKHFQLISNRMEELGGHYGMFPVHEGLWESAEITAHNLEARLVIVHCVHEARGLDITPKNISRLRSSGDKDSAEMLETIYREEITHVRDGMKWFRWICRQNNDNEKEEFISLVDRYFKGNLKPPFNVEARSAAGFPQDWYETLANRQQQEKSSLSQKE